MQDNDIDNLLCDWSNAQLPDDDKRDKILRSVLVRSEQTVTSPLRRQGSRETRLKSSVWIPAFAGMTMLLTVAATILFLATPPPLPEPTMVVQVAPPQETAEKIRISLIVLKRLPDSDTAVEFLEDSIFVAEEKMLHELELGEHRFFLWIYPLDKTLFALDVGLDKTAETGIVTVPDRPLALQFDSNGDRFDVFVSVLPHS